MKYNNFSYIISAASWLLLSYLTYFNADANQRRFLGGEDGPFETASAIFFLLASIIFFIAFLKNKNKNKNKNDTDLFMFKTNRNIFFFLLSILFLFAFLEEISWGQRILNITTPQNIKDMNLQGELNIHNLEIFHGITEDGTTKSGWQNMITMERLFNIFWLVCCFLIPFLYKINSRIKKQLERINFPIAPLSIGTFFVLNYLLAKIIFFSIDDTLRLNEIKECNYAFLFFILSVWFIKNYEKNNTV